MDEQKYQSLFAELSEYENCGITIRLENHPASPMQVVTAHMIKEDSIYMRDYVWDEKGKIRELTFHHIENN